MTHALEFEDEIILPPDYQPQKNEEYMCTAHLAYFKKKLLDWRHDLLNGSAETIHSMQEETHEEPDLTDRATNETDRALELRTRDRERKLLNKIEQALMRIEEGQFGYCEETGDPIGLARLEARPIATLSLEAQEQHERLERTHRD